MPYPDNNPKTAQGAKKAPLHLVPPVAIIAEAGAFKLGAEKYGAYNWRQHKVSSSVYVAAALRHIVSYHDGEDIDAESGASHLGHARACLAILLDADSIGMLNDDRPIQGAAGRVLTGNTPQPTLDELFPDYVKANGQRWAPGDEVECKKPDVLGMLEKGALYKVVDVMTLSELPGTFYLKLYNEANEPVEGEWDQNRFDYPIPF